MIRQRGELDCGIAALAMLLHESYEAVHDALVATRGTRPLRRGAVAQDLVATAAYLGRRLRRSRRAALDPARVHGVLGVDFDDSQGHWTLVAGGYVFDTNGYVWTVRDYIAASGGRVDILLYL